MSRLDPQLLAEKSVAIERHLARVEQRLPPTSEDFRPATDASDAVILHLWQAVQAGIDLALSACIQLGLGTPPTYGAAFQRLAEGGVLEAGLAGRLVRAEGFRNVVAHTYEALDMQRVYQAAKNGPTDLRDLLKALAQRVGNGAGG